MIWLVNVWAENYPITYLLVEGEVWNQSSRFKWLNRDLPPRFHVPMKTLCAKVYGNPKSSWYTNFSYPDLSVYLKAIELVVALLTLCTYTHVWITIFVRIMPSWVQLCCGSFVCLQIIGKNLKSHPGQKKCQWQWLASYCTYEIVRYRNTFFR
jgi:hypothetical protein